MAWHSFSDYPPGLIIGFVLAGFCFRRNRQQRDDLHRQGRCRIDGLFDHCLHTNGNGGDPFSCLFFSWTVYRNLIFRHAFVGFADGTTADSF